MPGPRRSSTAAGSASIPRPRCAPSRIERGIGAALPAGDPLPFLARLDGGWLRSLQLALDASTTTGSATSSSFNFHRQRALWRDLEIDKFAPWQVVAVLWRWWPGCGRWRSWPG